MRARVSGFAWLQGAVLVAVTNRSKYAWRPLVSMHISFCVHFRRCVEAVDAQNHLGEKWRRMSDVSRKVRAGGRHCPGVAVPGRHDQCASPDSLRPSRYSFFHDVCIVSLSGKSLSCVSVCNVEMQCLLAKWLILSLVLAFGTSLDRSCIRADRFRRSDLVSWSRASAKVFGKRENSSSQCRILLPLVTRASP